VNYQQQVRKALRSLQRWEAVEEHEIGVAPDRNGDLIDIEEAEEAAAAALAAVELASAAESARLRAALLEIKADAGSHTVVREPVRAPGFANIYEIATAALSHPAQPSELWAEVEEVAAMVATVAEQQEKISRRLLLREAARRLRELLGQPAKEAADG
jgi:hypothetical protein